LPTNRPELELWLSVIQIRKTDLTPGQARAEIARQQQKEAEDTMIRSELEAAKRRNRLSGNAAKPSTHQKRQLATRDSNGTTALRGRLPTHAQRQYSLPDYVVEPTVAALKSFASNHIVLHWRLYCPRFGGKTMALQKEKQLDFCLHKGGCLPAIRRRRSV
jgi:hypothetical protein